MNLHWAGRTAHSIHHALGMGAMLDPRPEAIAVLSWHLPPKQRSRASRSSFPSSYSCTHLDSYSVFSPTILHQIQLGFTHTLYENCIAHPFSLLWIFPGHGLDGDLIASISHFTLAVACSVCERFRTVSFPATSKLFWPTFGFLNSATMYLTSRWYLVF